MEMPELCPRCSHNFEARACRVKAHPSQLVLMLLPTSPREVPGAILFAVSCPSCRAVFQSRTLRYLGWVSYPVYIAALFAALVMLASAAVFFWHRE
jgi:hypothetical protein